MNRTAELPVLIGQAGPLNGQRWVIGQVLMMGREPGCDIVIPDRQVSRYHARLTPGPEGVLLEDLGSKNGTYVNANLISDPQMLQDSDLLQIALVQSFVFLSSDATMPMEGMDLPVISRASRRLFLDTRSRRVWVGTQEVLPPLSASQFRLLQALYDQQGEVVSRQELVSAVWGGEEAFGVSDQALDALARRLRERLTALDPRHNYILTVRGHGLRLDNPAA
ncbi:FHA domain-containing protein [Levilinea saccharolytica]|uniref:FHA domain-containing protein n=1 Tax=Levilinea saccharolytica TaxID=229921 RepID=UPI0009E4BEE9|nr:FHA domain-containing protein [Levilinea saccharolytica]GAP18567.1 response regulator consisting of a CheY-like receiver domain and a winged-helix DNA-binding domain [Levilinea saccharolytica]